MGDFRMPSLGADMESGKVVEWLVKPGDYVHRGDLVAEVDTEKTVMEVESFEEGVVTEFLVDLGESVPVGTPIARITGTPADGATAGSPAPDVIAPTGPQTVTTVPEPAAEQVAAPVTPPVRRLAEVLGVDLAQLHGTGRNGAVTRSDVESAAGHAAASTALDVRSPAPEPHQGRVRSSPRARRLAAERGVDLARVHGTGPGSAVLASDIEHESGIPVAAEPASAPLRPDAAHADTGADRVAKLHQAVGTLMTRSKREIPHYYLSTTIDFAAASDWMQRVNSDRPITQRLVPAALLLAVTARAAKSVPDVNGFFLDGAFQPSTGVHLGVAVALRGGGLIAPAIHDADTLSIDELMSSLRDLVARARAGRLQRAEMADPTITVTNLGDLGVESIFGVIYPPQVALVGFGRIVERPVARGGLIGVRPTLIATMSADHRASDGLVGGRLLARIDDLLQKPEEL